RPHPFRVQCCGVGFTSPSPRAGPRCLGDTALSWSSVLRRRSRLLLPVASPARRSPHCRGAGLTRRFVKRGEVDGLVALTEVEGVTAPPARTAFPKVGHCPTDSHRLAVEAVGVGEQLTHRERSRL